jgi:heme/copper-type cytochrome/quinol oxidase subunit 2
MPGDPVVVLYACGALALGVFALMIGSLVALHRAARPTPFAGARSTCADLLWSLVPITMIVGLVWPAIHAIFRR